MCVCVCIYIYAHIHVYIYACILYLYRIYLYIKYSLGNLLETHMKRLQWVKHTSLGGGASNVSIRKQASVLLRLWEHGVVTLSIL